MVCALSHTTVDGLYRRNLVDIALYEVRELVDELSTFEARDVLAPGGVECLAGRSDGNVDVLFGSCRELD